MRIRYNKTLYILFFSVSFISLAIYVTAILMRIDISLLNFIPLVICFYIGYRYKSADYFEINDKHVKVFALVGSNSKIYDINGLQDLRVDGNRLWIDSKKPVRVRVNQNLANKNDWNEMLKMIAEVDLTREIHDI